MQSEWREVLLGDVIDIKHGFAFKSEYFVDKATEYALVTPGNFAIGGGFQEQNPKFYEGPFPAEYILKIGDLVVTMTDLSKAGDTLGFGAIVPRTDNFVYLHNQRIGLIQQKNHQYETDKNYLSYLLRMSDYRHWIVGSATGSTVKHTSPSRIQAYKFLLPSLPEQRAIARVLGCLDDKIELNRRTNATLESLAQTLFRAWFVDFEPVKAKAAGVLPLGMDAQTATLFPSEFEPSTLGLIPKGWEVRSLDTAAEFLNGLALQKYRPEANAEWLPVIKISQLRKGSADGEERASTHIGANYIVNNGDVLFSWSGSLEVRIWCGGRGALNQHLFKVTSAKFPKWFYYFWTLHHLEFFRGIAADKATTMGHIQRRHLTEAKVVVPPSAQLEAMGKVIAPLLDRQINNSLESQTLAHLRDALLPRLISGRLRVPDAMREVEATA